MPVCSRCQTEFEEGMQCPKCTGENSEKVLLKEHGGATGALVGLFGYIVLVCIPMGDGKLGDWVIDHTVTLLGMQTTKGHVSAGNIVATLVFLVGFVAFIVIGWHIESAIGKRFRRSTGADAR